MESTGQQQHTRISELLLSMRRMQHQMKHMFGVIAQEEGLTQGMVFLLLTLSHGPLKISDIAEHFGTTAGAATGMTDKLEEIRLVTRMRSTEDRRIVYVSLTEEGEQRVKRIRERYLALAASVFADLDEDALVQMTATINHIADTMACFFERRKRR